uniref:DUF3668 domain-containing protein n=1 Tax=Spongospora subterranea TaxID=70186 RepID=A0A0H5RA38_9EUKA|eukprot:CRZ10542.1 hypothetical protein [Spongospora subterranea]
MSHGDDDNRDSHARLRISVKARGVGDILIARPCYFCVQATIGSDFSTVSDWFPAPVYKASRHELDFGIIELEMSALHLSKLKNVRSPLKLALLAAPSPLSPIPIIAGFVLIDYRTFISGSKYEIPKQWYRLQSAKSKQATPELNVGCKLSWDFTKPHGTESNFENFSTDQPVEVETPELYDDDFEDSGSQTGSSKIDVLTDSKDSTTVDKPVETVEVSSLPNEGTAESARSSHADHIINPEFNHRMSNLKTMTHIPVDEHHYRISVDLRSVRDLDRSGLVYARYVYPLFGDSETVATHPAVQFELNHEVFLPNSFCAFELDMKPTELERVLSEDPFVVEVIAKNEDQTESVIGLATLNMTELLSAPRVSVETGHVRAVDIWVPIFNSGLSNFPSRDIQLAGSLRCTVFLEDFGERQPTQFEVSQISECDAEAERGSQAYHVAWELEAWKRREQETFKVAMEEMKTKRTQEVEDELHELVLKKESLLSQKKKEISQLEKKLGQVLFDIRNQERVLRHQEEEHVKLKESLIREHDLRIREDAAVLKSLRRQHAQELAIRDREKTILESRVTELERMYADQIEHVMSVKKKMATSTVGKLQNDLADVNRHLQTALEEIDQSKVKEKRLQSQLVSCLKELARLRQTSEIVENERLERERLELQRLRIQLMAKHQQRDLDADRGQLQSIRNDIRRMLSNDRQSLSESPKRLDDDNIRQDDAEHVANREEYERLQGEKTDLLRSGIYSLDHELIKRINERIQSLKVTS